MTRIHTTDDVRAFMRFHPEPLDGIEEAEQEWWLGTLSLNKQYPYFRSGYSHRLQQDARFIKRWFQIDADGRRGWAVIFQAFDPASPNPEPPEYLVGWVPPEREPDLDRWIAFLNAEIHNRLKAQGKRTLRLVGGFHEIGYDDDPDAPRLSELRGKRSPEHKADVVRYLTSGKGFIFSPGIDRDIFDETKLADTPSIMTDGTYAWPKLVAYYVDRYDVELPSHFEAHMQANQWVVPGPIDTSTLALPGAAWPDTRGKP